MLLNYGYLFVIFFVYLSELLKGRLYLGVGWVGIEVDFLVCCYHFDYFLLELLYGITRHAIRLLVLAIRKYEEIRMNFILNCRVVILQNMEISEYNCLLVIIFLSKISIVPQSFATVFAMIGLIRVKIKNFYGCVMG